MMGDVRRRFAFALLLAAGCGHTRGVGGALRRVDPPPLADDLPLAPLLDAVEAELRLLERAPGPREVRFGERTFVREAWLAALRRFVALGRAATTAEAFQAAVLREFDFYSPYPDGVLVTAYYHPVLHGARAPAGRFTQPLYRPPPDLRHPSFTRAEIDSGHALAGRGLELCWVDPLDAFVLQTEGSGTIDFGDGGSLTVAAAGHNGRPHQRLARVLRGAIPPARMSMQSIEAYLRALPEPAMRRILEQDQRYVFFQAQDTDGAATTLGVAATDGRTIAADARNAVRGALAWLVTERPRLAGGGGSTPLGWEPLGRFVLDQDTGGGIRDAHVDLFWGRGEDAARYAGVMKRHGRIYYLVPKH